jgi:mRNA-degrading endonuclease RelE of RelBE toxin-antitoxin system
MYEILLHDRVIKFYNKLDNKSAGRINRAIEELQKNPASGKDSSSLYLSTSSIK